MNERSNGQELVLERYLAAIVNEARTLASGSETTVYSAYEGDDNRFIREAFDRTGTVNSQDIEVRAKTVGRFIENEIKAKGLHTEVRAKVGEDKSGRRYMQIKFMSNGNGSH